MGRNSDVRVNFLGDADSLARAAARSRRELDAVERHAHLKSTALGTAVGTIAGRAIAGVASVAAGGIRTLVGETSNAIAAASAMNETLSKSNAVFGGNALAVQAWAADNSKNLLLSSQAALEGAATFGNLFVSMGAGTKPAADLSLGLVSLAEDLSSFNDVDTGQALADLRSGLLGEVEPLRKYGISLSAARVEAEAYALGLVKPVKNAAAITAANNAVAAATQNVAKVEKEHGKSTLAAAQARDKLTAAETRLTKATAGSKVVLTALQKAQAAYAIVQKDTATAHGDAARTIGAEANASRHLQAQLANLEVQLGQKLLPAKLKVVKATSQLITEFERGTGTGGQLRDTLQSAAGTAKAFGDAILPVVRFLATHPKVFFTLAAGVVAFKVASAAAAFRAGALGTALFGVAGAETATALAAPAAATGIAAVGAAGATAVPRLAATAFTLGSVAAVAGQVAVALGAAYAAWQLAKTIGKVSTGSETSSDFNTNDPNLAPGTSTGGMLSSDGTYTPDALPVDRATPVVDDSVPSRGRHSQGKPGGVVAKATASATATKTASDKTAAAQKYATDQYAKNEAKHNAAVQAAADKKAKAADAMKAAQQKLDDALQARKDLAGSVRDNLVSSNGVLRDGRSFVAKDLLTRYRDQLAKVKQFAAAISALTHKGYAPAIVQQVAAAGVDGLATAKALAAASAGQVSQFNAVDAGIQKAAQYAGDRTVKGVLGATPIQLTSTIVMPDGKVLARVVNDANAQASGGRPGVRTR